MYYAACSLKLYIRIDYTTKIDSELCGIEVSILTFMIKYLNMKHL